MREKVRYGVMKTQSTVFRMIALFMVAVMMVPIVGCSQKPTEPMKDQEPVQDPAIVAAEQQAKLYEAVIAKMDKYVTTNADGTFNSDYQGFLSANQLTGDEMKVADELNKGILVVNQKILEMANTGAVAKVWFQRYWWGYKECYSELSAEYMLDGMLLTIYGLAIYPSAKYLYYHFGYFCIYHTWIGGVWANL